MGLKLQKLLCDSSSDWVANHLLVFFAETACTYLYRCSVCATEHVKTTGHDAAL